MRLPIALTSLLVCTFIFNTLFAQPDSWSSLGTVTNNEFSPSIQGSELHNSSTLGSIIFSGPIHWSDNGDFVSSWWLVRYTDGEWLPMVEVNEPIYGTVNNLHDYQDGLIFSHFSEDEVFDNYFDIYYIEDNTPELLGSFQSYSEQFGVHVEGDEIYIAGKIISDDEESFEILKYADGEWVDAFESLPPIVSVWGIGDLHFYQDDFYMGGGNMIDTDGEEHNLWKYSEGVWSVVQDESGNTFTGTVYELSVYQEQMVIAHGIGNTNYSPEEGRGSGILFWDGNLWSGPQPLLDPQGNPNSNAVLDLEVIEDELFALGNYWAADEGTPIRYLARWTGNSWCGMQTEEWDLIAFNMTQLDGHIVHFQNQWSFIEAFIHDGETFSPCTVPVSVEEQQSLETTLFPNPSHGQVTVSGEQPITRLEVFDLQGRMITTHAPNSSTFNLSGMSSGSYIVVIYSDERVVREKVVVR